MERYGNIEGWGKWDITNADLEKTLDTSDEWIVTRTGIRERPTVEDGETPSSMSVSEARMALHKALSRPGNWI